MKNLTNEIYCKIREQAYCEVDVQMDTLTWLNIYTHTYCHLYDQIRDEIRDQVENQMIDLIS